MHRQHVRHLLTALAVVGTLSIGNLPHSHAASHREAALIAQDPEADQTDFYAFVGKNDAGQKVLNVISAYIPAEEPGAGPNYYRFADDALYEINIENDAKMVNGAPVFSGKPNLTYQFHFKTTYKNPATILSYGLGSAAGPIMKVGDTHTNETQTYTVMQLDRATGNHTDLTGGQTLQVPPDNLGHTTPLYSVDGKGNGVAKQGATSTAQLDDYTRESIYSLSNGIKVFAGQRLDGFYFDINGTFDLLGLRKPGVNSLKGYNCHVIAMQIPISLVTRSSGVPIVGLYADAARRELRIRSSAGLDQGHWTQVSRLANPGVNEVLIPAAVRDHWNQVPPSQDEQFRKYIEHPELVSLINFVFGTKIPTDKPRTDLSGLLMPDLLKVDTSTDPVRLEMDKGFSRLTVLGGDTVLSPFQKKQIPSGWPNGRRLGDDVIDIALTVIGNPPGTTKLLPLGDNVDSNGVPYNQVFPFAQTPASGRTHYHDPSSPAQ